MAISSLLAAASPRMIHPARSKLHLVPICCCCNAASSRGRTSPSFRLAADDQRFDFPDLPAAALDSHGPPCDAPARLHRMNGRRRQGQPAFPVYSWYRRTIQSAYLGSISIRRALRRRRSQAIKVEPAPAQKSPQTSPTLLLFTRARSTNSTGFIVGCRRFAAGLFSCHNVDWLLSPYQASLCPAMWQ